MSVLPTKVEFFVGDDDQYSKNAKCPGGPYFTVGQKLGAEVWCNLEGKHVYMVADLSGIAPPYDVSMCSFGIMGTKYARITNVAKNFTIFAGATYSFDVQKITSQETLGNLLDIQMRSKAEEYTENWVTF